MSRDNAIPRFAAGSSLFFERYDFEKRGVEKKFSFTRSREVKTMNITLQKEWVRLSDSILTTSIWIDSSGKRSLLKNDDETGITHHALDSSCFPPD